MNQVISRQPGGTRAGGRFATTWRHEGDFELTDDDHFRQAVQAQRGRTLSLDQRLAELDRRYRLAIDSTLPSGVVRCVDCGRFVSEIDLAHRCPVPAMIADGVAPDVARRWAMSGFTTAFEVHCWGAAIDQLGLERAGQWRTTGVGPYDAVRLDRSGADPASLYRDTVLADPDPVDALRARVEATRERITDWTTAGFVPAADGSTRHTASAKEIVAEVVATGHVISEQIEGRIATRVAELDQNLRGRLADLGINADEIAEAWQRWQSNPNSGSFAGTMMSMSRDIEDPDRKKLLWSTAHDPAVFDFSKRRNEITVEETVAVLADLHETGGPIDAKVGRSVKATFDDAVSRLPSDWIAASDRSPLKLVVEASAARGSYCHGGRPKQKPKITREFEQRSGSVHVSSYYAEQAAADPAAYVASMHPESRYAEDSEEWKRAAGGTRKNMKLRTRNIRDVQYDPATRRIYYTSDNEVAHYTYPEAAPRTGTIKTSNSSGTMMHEMGHRLENTVPGVQTLVRSWRNQREEDAGNRRVRLPGRGEYGYDGGYVNPYVGRHYDSVLDTEVLSVGLEGVLTGSHGSLRGDGNEKADPDHRALILGLLTTTGRTNR